MRVHTYVIATDAGSAPNYDAPCTTLAVCKPRIRRKTNPGELVLAFAGHSVNPYEPHSVVWAGIVAERLTFADYWNDARFQSKKPLRTATPDNFYKPARDGGLVQVENPIHGPEATDRDTGGQYVLTFDRSWRFGAHGPILSERFGLRMVHGRRGERLHDLSDASWRDLEHWLDSRQTTTTPAKHSTRRCQPTPQPPAKTRPRC